MSPEQCRGKRRRSPHRHLRVRRARVPDADRRVSVRRRRLHVDPDAADHDEPMPPSTHLPELPPGDRRRRAVAAAEGSRGAAAEPRAPRCARSSKRPRCRHHRTRQRRSGPVTQSSRRWPCRGAAIPSLRRPRRPSAAARGDEHPPAPVKSRATLCAVIAGAAVLALAGAVVVRARGGGRSRPRRRSRRRHRRPSRRSRST